MRKGSSACSSLPSDTPTSRTAASAQTTSKIRSFRHLVQGLTSECPAGACSSRPTLSVQACHTVGLGQQLPFVEGQSNKESGHQGG